MEISILGKTVSILKWSLVPGSYFQKRLFVQQSLVDSLDGYTNSCRSVLITKCNVENCIMSIIIPTNESVSEPNSFYEVWPSCRSSSPNVIVVIARRICPRELQKHWSWTQCPTWTNCMASIKQVAIAQAKQQLLSIQLYMQQVMGP